MTTQREFIKKLQRLLLWKYNSSEIGNIVQEYEQYFDNGKRMGKTEKKMCQELGNPLAIVRELRIKRQDKNAWKYLNKKALKRGGALVIWLFLFMYSMYLSDHEKFTTNKLIICNFIMLLGGWHIVGKREFTRAWMEQVGDRYRGLEVTILHSVFLIMALLSFTLVSKVLMSWEMIFMIENGDPIYLKGITMDFLAVFIIIAVMIILLSIYKYRMYSVEYYSIICHGMGFIGTILNYINTINHVDSRQWNADIIFQCEWVYVESLVLAGGFLLYCDWCRRIGKQKYSPY